MIAFTVNGERKEIDLDSDVPLLWVLREHFEADGCQVWVRHCRLWRLHGARRRKSGSIVHHSDLSS